MADDPWAEFRIKTEAQPPPADPWADFRINPAEDVVKQLGVGLGKGAIGVAGMGGDVRELIAKGVGMASKAAGYEVPPDMVAEGLKKIAVLPMTAPLAGPTSAELQGKAEEYTGEFRKPQTTPGHYAETIGEFIPGSVLGPANSLRAVAGNALKFGILPGGAAEAADEAAKGTKMEPWAKGLAGLGTGVGAAALFRPNTAEMAIKRSLPRDVDPQSVTQAGQLIEDAAAQGIRLTWPEALKQVDPRIDLTALQRTLEAARDSRPAMSEFFADRPQQIEAAARQQFEQIAPAPAVPHTIGPAVGREAEGVVNGVRDAINRNTEPFYTAASTIRLTPAEMAQVRALPGYREARAAVRGDDQINRYVRHLPDDSVGFLNEVKKWFEQARENATSPLSQNPNMQRAAGYGQDARDVRQIALDASGRAAGPGNPNLYEVALSAQEQTRRQYLEPLLQGPLGKLADKDIATKKAIDALFPAEPLANSQQEVSTTVRALANRNAPAAEQLVRAHVEATFNDAAKNLQGGPNQWGGGNFAKALTGHAQQEANLQAAIEALPNGATRWDGFERFMDIMEATAARKQVGTHTAFSIQELKDLGKSKIGPETAKMAAAPQRILTELGDAWDRWTLRGNLTGLAQILTSRESGPILQRIAHSPTNSGAAIANAWRLVNIARNSVEKEARPPDTP